MSSIRLPLFIVALVLLAGCDEGIEPTPGEDRPFAIFGQFDVFADTQAVRVIEITDTIDTLDPDTIDARVESTLLQTGETRAWADSLVRFGNGTRGHVFFSPFQVEHGETHQLRVERSDGVAAEVTVTVPPLTTLDSLRREGRAAPTRYVIGVDDAPRLTGVQATYTFVGDIPTRVQVIRHTDRAERTESGWEVAIPFEEDISDILDTFANGPVGLLDFEVSVYVSNEEWNVEAVGGTFEPDVLVQPGTLSNVENGFGFYGAGYRLTRPLRPFVQDEIRAGLCILNTERTGCRE